jgi:hypothetical protein
MLLVEMTNVFWLENIKGRDHLGDLGVSDRIILKYIVEK